MAASKKAVVLTQSDIDHLKSWMAKVDRFIKRQGQTPRADEIDKFQTTPEIYVARTPVAGIAALTEETGTGIEDTPGSALCNVYKLSEGSGRLVPLGYYEQVHNLNQTSIGGNRWVIIKQDALGVWWVEAPFPAPEHTETGTGTGLDQPHAPCGGATFNTHRVYCELDAATGLYFLNEYRVSITLYWDSNGCLRQTTGAENFVRTVSCCDVSCVDTSVTGTTGTGTGTTASSGGSIVTSCCPDGLPAVLYLSGGSLGSVTLTYSVIEDKWLGTTNAGASEGAGKAVRFYCSGSGPNAFTVDRETAAGNNTFLACTCINGEDSCEGSCTGPVVYPTLGAALCGTVTR